MPYDPRAAQLTQMGIGMLSPQPPFQQTQQTPQRPKQWWEQPLPVQAQQGNQPGQSANSPKPPPGLLDMMMNLGRMSRPQYDKAIAGQGGMAQGNAMVSPWAFLGSMGLPGGAGWGGGGQS